MYACICVCTYVYTCSDNSMLSCLHDRLRGSSHVDHHELTYIPCPGGIRFDFDVFFLFEVLSKPRPRTGRTRGTSCHGSIEVFDAPVPRTMLEAFPEEVQSSVLVPYDRMPAAICPRYLSSKICNPARTALHAPRFYQRALGRSRSDLSQVVPRFLRLLAELLEPTWFPVRGAMHCGLSFADHDAGRSTSSSVRGQRRRSPSTNQPRGCS